MKKLFSGVSCAVIMLAMLFAFASPSYAAADIGELWFDITASSSSVKIGGTVDVTVTLKNTTAYEISDLSFKLSYNNSKFGVCQANTQSGVDCVLSHSSTTLSGSQGSITVNYSATNKTTNKPIATNETFSVSIKMLALTTNTGSDNAVFSLSDATAIMRTDVTSKVSSSSNLSHTFTFKTNYPSINVSISALSNNADLTSLIPMVNNTEKELSPAFSSDITEYRITVLYEFPGIEFTITKADSKATAELIPPKNSKYVVGDNTVKIVVTAEDKTTTKTYTIIINRLAAGQTLPSTPGTTTTAQVISGTDITTLPTETTASSIPTTQYTNPSGSGETTIVKEGGLDTKIHLNLATLLGLVAGGISLFILAFYSGYLTHKNALRPDKLSLDDIIAAQEQLANMPDQTEILDEVPEAEYTETEADLSDNGEYFAESYNEGEYDPNQYVHDEYAQDEYAAGDFGQEYIPEYANGENGQVYNQPGMFDGYAQEYMPTVPQQDEAEYDEYGYNAEGESNYQQIGPSGSIYYT